MARVAADAVVAGLAAVHRPLRSGRPPWIGWRLAALHPLVRHMAQAPGR